MKFIFQKVQKKSIRKFYKQLKNKFKKICSNKFILDDNYNL